MGVSFNNFATIRVNRTRGNNIWLPWGYWWISMTCPGDNSGGSAVLNAYWPDLALELWATLDRYSWKVLAVSQTPSLFIPASAALDPAPIVEDVIEQVDQGASMLYHAQPGLSPKFLGKLNISPGNTAAFMTVNLGNNANLATGAWNMQGRLFDHEPMGAM